MQCDCCMGLRVWLEQLKCCGGVRAWLVWLECCRGERGWLVQHGSGGGGVFGGLVRGMDVRRGVGRGSGCVFGLEHLGEEGCAWGCGLGQGQGRACVWGTWGRRE